eukprot:PhF_6_TR2354/c0_g1_i2/m.4223
MKSFTEFRLPFPCTSREYQRGLIHLSATIGTDLTLASANGQEGVVTLETSSFQSLPNEVRLYGRYPLRVQHAATGGVFTHKLIFLESSRTFMLPPEVTQFLPPGCAYVEEFSWCSFPYTFTMHRMNIPDSTPDKYVSVTYETICLDEDMGNTRNVFQLSAEDEQSRVVDVIDVGTDPTAQFTPVVVHWDPANTQSTLTRRGPLMGDWRRQVRPIMCVYILVNIKSSFDGVAESHLARSIRNVLLNTHKNLFSSLDQWIYVSQADLTKYDEQVASKIRMRYLGERGWIKVMLQHPEPPTTPPDWFVAQSSMPLTNVRRTVTFITSQSPQTVRAQANGTPALLTSLRTPTPQTSFTNGRTPSPKVLLASGVATKGALKTTAAASVPVSAHVGQGGYVDEDDDDDDYEEVLNPEEEIEKEMRRMSSSILSNLSPNSSVMLNNSLLSPQQQQQLQQGIAHRSSSPAYLLKPPKPIQVEEPAHAAVGVVVPAQQQYDDEGNDVIEFEECFRNGATVEGGGDDSDVFAGSSGEFSQTHTHVSNNINDYVLGVGPSQNDAYGGAEWGEVTPSPAPVQYTMFPAQQQQPSKDYYYSNSRVSTASVRSSSLARTKSSNSVRRLKSESQQCVVQ